MKSKYILTLLIYFTSFQIYSQVDDIVFQQVSPPGGFSFQAVDIVAQDLFGYIWMGSSDGILKYDSKKVKRFIYDSQNKKGLPSNKITGISIDNKNNVWVSTDHGLCLFNRKSQTFELVDYTYENGDKSNKYLNSITTDGKGNLWIADAKFFGLLNREKNQLERITKGLKQSPRLLYTDETNRIWIGTSNGNVYLALPNENKAIRKIKGPGSLTRTIFATHNEIWVGYEKHGARLYDIDGTQKHHYTYSLEPEFDIKSASIRKIYRDTRGRIWIGSYLGLFQNVGSNLVRFASNEYSGLPHNSIYEIFEDNQGGIWLGTWSGGVSYLHHANNKFNNYRYSKDPTSLSNNMVSSFAQTFNGDIFVGTEQGGLNKFNLETNSFQKIKVLEKNEVLNVKTLCVDDNNGLWVGSAFKGLYYRPPNKNKFIRIKKEGEDRYHILTRQIYSLCNSDSGMWIGSSSGLYFYNIKTNKISYKSKDLPFSQIANSYVRAITLDSNNTLWVATLNGMYRIHLPSKKLTRFSPNSTSNHKTKNSAFHFVTELSDRNIWMGTRNNGINIYNPKTDITSYFDANGLLKGKDVYGIIEGLDNNIWITSNNGLIQYNRKEKITRRFTITDGIQGNLFNPNAILKDKDENLFLGGTNGFTLLKPKKIRTNKWPPNIFINNIKANNQDITPSQIALNTFKKVILDPYQHHLRFDFSADNYLLPEQNKFQYRLKNYSNRWIMADNDGSATFANIPAGNYIFEVKACNNNGIWNENPASLPIVIKQFWYKSTLAISLYILVLIAIFIIIFRYYLERLNLKKAILIEKIERKNEDQLHEMKLRFFTNISHEFRTPLTLINSPVKNLLESKNLTSEQLGQLNTVKRNTNRLLLLINQIMDLRKLEKGKAKLNISKIDLIDFVNERILNFSEEAKLKNIQFTFNHEINECFIETDEDKLDKIIYNLLSNAFKFTPTNGKIKVTIQGNQSKDNIYFSNQLSFGKLENEDFIEIQVTDDGDGIDSQDLPNIFDRFEQGKQKKVNENGTGIGLNLCKDYTLLHRGEIIVQSTPDKGTRFLVRLPIKQRAQKILYESHEKVKNIDSWKPRVKTDVPLKINKKESNILVVEDNEELRDYLIQFLENFYSVLYAKNGKQGLEILHKHNIQLVISDVMMPVMDGFEFCTKIKSQIETSHIPVILLTALSSVENTTTGLDKGADAYISKPFEEEMLLSQIKNLILQRKSLQDSFNKKFISKQPIDIGSLDNYFLNKVNTLIEKNIQNEEFSVEKLAEEIGFSRSQLHRKLKQISNSTTSEYIMMVKIKKATTLLISGEFNIDEIAHKTGFSSHSYFTKCFKKIHNVSPKEFLKNL